MFAGRVPEEGEPLWLPEDRDTALVWQAMKRTRCPGCGTWDWEWEEDPHAWEGDLWRCHGCREIDGQHDRLREASGSTNGLRVRLFKGGMSGD